jgi:hypothetical protein
MEPSANLGSIHGLKRRSARKSGRGRIEPESRAVTTPVSNRSRWSRLGEIIGLVGVMGSLIFVGLEVRQSAIATRAAADATIANSFLQVNQAMATTPSLDRALTAWHGTPDSASEADQVQILGLYRGLVHVWSNAHQQHLNGTIDPALYQSIVQEVSAYARPSSVLGDSAELERRGVLLRWTWSRERFLFNPDFQAFVDSMLGPGPP